MENVHFINQDLEGLSVEALNLIKENIEKELQDRKNKRRDELIQRICDSMNALYHEFHNVELRVSWECDCGCEDDIDALYELCSGRKMTPKDFICY